MAKRRRRILCLLLVLGVAVCPIVHVVHTAWDHRGPRIEIVNESVDLGMIDGLKRNVPGRVAFTIRNRGSEVLRLTKLHTRCPCLKPRLNKDVLMPGEVAELSVRVLVPDKLGEFKENISLSSNDPRNPVRRLMIKGIVHRYCDILPRSLAIDHLRLGEERRVTVEIVGPVGDELFAVQNAQVKGEKIRVETIRKTRSVAQLARSVWTVALIVTGRGETDWEDTVVLSTSSDKARSVEVPLIVRELPPVRASPAVAILTQVTQFGGLTGVL